MKAWKEIKPDEEKGEVEKRSKTDDRERQRMARRP
jgi:hypothetical protein